MTEGEALKADSIVVITLGGAGLDNNTSVKGDERYLPFMWNIDKGALKGSLNTAPYEFSFNTANLAAGAHTLSVSFWHQRFGDDGWVNTPERDTVVKTVNFSVKQKTDSGGTGQKPDVPGGGGSGNPPGGGPGNLSGGGSNSSADSAAKIPAISGNGPHGPATAKNTVDAENLSNIHSTARNIYGVQTGDTDSLLFWMLMAALSAVSSVTAILYIKSLYKKNQKR